MSDAARDVLDVAPGWLPAADLSSVRDRVPMVYVDAVPVLLNHLGEVEKVGLLLRRMPDGSISRAVVSGRIHLGETIRDALWRHVTKDLGHDADPALPASPQPFTVAEYFPDPTRTGYHDPRQHAVSLAYVVAIAGDPAPQQDALQFSWLTPSEALAPDTAAEMGGGHDKLLRLALAHCGI